MNYYIWNLLSNYLIAISIYLLNISISTTLNEAKMRPVGWQRYEVYGLNNGWDEHKKRVEV